MRLIDADELEEELVIHKYKYSPYLHFLDVAATIERMPTIDAVPVVRCKDCASFRYSGMGGDNGITYCSMGIEMQPTDFCSYGEREDDETD